MQVDAVELNTGGKPLRMRIDKPLGQFETVLVKSVQEFKKHVVFHDTPWYFRGVKSLSKLMNYMWC